MGQILKWIHEILNIPKQVTSNVTNYLIVEYLKKYEPDFSMSSEEFLKLKSFFLFQLALLYKKIADSEWHASVRLAVSNIGKSENAEF